MHLKKWDGDKKKVPESRFRYNFYTVENQPKASRIELALCSGKAPLDIQGIARSLKFTDFKMQLIVG